MGCQVLSTVRNSYRFIGGGSGGGVVGVTVVTFVQLQGVQVLT